MIRTIPGRKRKSIRLKGYDYSSVGAYFVTMCTHNRECLFGRIVNGEMELSPIGQIAWQCWSEIPKHFAHIQLDVGVLMPNHLHGLLLIHPVGVQHVEPQRNRFQHIIPKSIGSIIRQYKSSVTRICRQQNYLHFRWQRNYYDRIVRNEKEMNRIRDYIVNNPLQWFYDEENPAGFVKS